MCANSAAGHRPFAKIAYRHDGNIYVSQHYALPFGATASVHGWDRIGCLLRALARKLFHIVVFRYVDDFSGPDRKENIEHTRDIIARLVRVCLGHSAILERKLESGLPLIVLGVETNIDKDGIHMFPSRDKVNKWSVQLKETLSTGLMTSGEASKLSGALQWAGQHAFRRLGRAMLRPIMWHIR